MPRTRKIPEKFDDYLHSMGGSAYSLSKRDRFLLKGFKQYFNTRLTFFTTPTYYLLSINVLMYIAFCRKEELDIVCTLVASEVLHSAMEEGIWFDTNILYYWFDVLREKCQTAFMADPSICVSI